MAAGKTSHRRLKICCAVTVVLLVIITVVAIALAFTIFKPKDPIITLHPEGLQNFTSGFSMFMNLTANFTFTTVISIENQNYGSFLFKNTTAYVNYRGDLVGEAPIAGRHVPARDKLNLTTSVSLVPRRLLDNSQFLGDLAAERFNLTSTATLPGKVSLLKIFKLHGTVNNRCNISIFVHSRSAESICQTKLKL
ncbi:uncharacterized protein LOC132181585 [Corylus avellana]|uniref:uncharacterized protein LOC132181585 n=1 Tax=Corylus avellana TaxID=13451 RepID=UPI001E201560|nr:uncharacterized protein LOC132181585 [Corylus avellana]